MSSAKFELLSPPSGESVEARLREALAQVDACRRDRYRSKSEYQAERDRLYAALAQVTSDYIRALQA